MKKVKASSSFLDETIQVVFIQMRLTDRGVPDVFKNAPAAPGVNRSALKVNGEVVVSPSENTDVSELSNKLRQTGFVLVDAVAHFCYQEGVYRVRFVFSRDKEQIAAATSRRAFLDGVARGELARLLDNATYSATVYRNPSSFNGQIVEGRNHFSVNLNARTPLYQVAPKAKISITDDRRIALVAS